MVIMVSDLQLDDETLLLFVNVRYSYLFRLLCPLCILGVPRNKYAEPRCRIVRHFEGKF